MAALPQRRLMAAPGRRHSGTPQPHPPAARRPEHGAPQRKPAPAAAAASVEPGATLG
ncbi:hypothetical protein [Streptomyces sp. 7N604]|uniref:hypothetical protein n=1 Tax=Streptomyces sp. 7N604 TaxID=3457415 RepID=UPI003FD22505